MITGYGSNCAGCGKKLGNAGNRSGFNKCIRCGLKYCEECWQPDFVDVCPKCSCSCK